MKLTSAARAAGRAVLVEQANSRAEDLAPVIAELRATGVTSLRGFAAALTARSIPTASGNGKWSAVQVVALWRGWRDAVAAERSDGLRNNGPRQRLALGLFVLPPNNPNPNGGRLSARCVPRSMQLCLDPTARCEAPCLLGRD